MMFRDEKKKKAKLEFRKKKRGTGVWVNNSARGMTKDRNGNVPDEEGKKSDLHHSLEKERKGIGFRRARDPC